jgi:perosamine synthetase
MIYLKSHGIATGCHYTPLTLHPLFKPHAKDCSYIEKEANKFITLPLHADLTDEEVDYILNHLIKFKNKC